MMKWWPWKGVFGRCYRPIWTKGLSTCLGLLLRAKKKAFQGPNAGPLWHMLNSYRLQFQEMAQLNPPPNFTSGVDSTLLA